MHNKSCFGQIALYFEGGFRDKTGGDIRRGRTKANNPIKSRTPEGQALHTALMHCKWTSVGFGPQRQM